VNSGFRGRISEYDDTGWNIFDLKLAAESLGANENQRLSLGLHFDSYTLNFIVDDYDSIAGERATDETRESTSGRADSGGKSKTSAIFAQYGLALGEHWDVSLGLRYDDWTAKEGYEGVVQVEERSEDGFSPKLSLAYLASDKRSFRYSLARGLRFPVIEEIFVNNADTGGSVADAELQPEDGIFHNLSYVQEFDSASVTVNLFYDEVEDAIFTQRGTLTDNDTTNDVTTFLPVGEVQTKGAELHAQFQEVGKLPLALRFNVTYTDTEITKNPLNQSIVGNDFPRIAEWRANVLASYKIFETLNVGASLRYASDTFGTLDNSDTEDSVFGAQDEYLFAGLKLNWQSTKSLNIAFGVDNVFDEQAYVYHPWPGRTYHLNAKYVIGD